MSHSQDRAELALAADFPAATEAQWLGLVEKVLKGADFEKRLVTRTDDGLAIRPLYTRTDAIPEAQAAVPGTAPFTRGRRGAPDGQGWDIRQLHADPDPAAANTAILEDLAGGVTSIALRIAAPGWSGLPYTGNEIAQTLDGVLLDVCPIALHAGEYTADAAGGLIALWRARAIAERDRLGALNADPLGTLAATGALYHPLPRALEIAARLAADTRAMPHVTALLADGRPYHAAGASEAQELGAMLATLVAYLRACEAAGLSPGQALPKIAVALAADTDQFLTIAKLRAARRLIWRVADACGAGGEAPAVAITAETATRMMATRDPWVNMLRTTMACAAAAMGGADAITVLPFTWALGRPDAFSRRVARNTHHVLMEESALGRVIDPAGGSWYVERLTDDLARAAWESFQGLEAAGGIGAALTAGSLQEAIGTTAKARTQRIATGRQELTGVSAFPLLGDDGVTAEPWPPALSADLNGARVTPLAIARLAAPFEALRDAADRQTARTGKPAQIFLAGLGPLAEHAARATWVKNALAAGGIATVEQSGLASAADVVAAFKTSGASVTCLCGTDAVYADSGVAAAKALKSAGAAHVYLAGRPGAREAELRAAGVDGFLFAGQDALATLGDLHRALGIV